MSKIVGIKDGREFKKKNGEPMGAYLVFMTAAGRDTVGEEAVSQWVDAGLFDQALKGRSFKELLGRDAVCVYDRRGFLQDFQVK